MRHNQPPQYVHVIQVAQDCARLVTLAKYDGGYSYQIPWDDAPIPLDLDPRLRKDILRVRAGTLRLVITDFPKEPGSYEFEIAYCNGPDPVLCGYFGRMAYKAVKPSKQLQVHV